MRLIRHSIVVLALTLLCLPGLALAGDAGRESPFSAGAGARALGMGGGFTSLADDASAVFYNPAGLPGVEYQEFSFMHMVLFEGTMYDFASWVYPSLSLGGFGLALMRIGTDDIIKRNNFIDEGSFGYSQTQLLISYGRRLQGQWSAGVSLKIVNQTLDNFSDYGIGVDFGMMAELGRNLGVGVMVRDMFPASLKLDTTREFTPVSVVGGLSLKQLKLNPHISVTASFELEKIENRATRVHTGAEAVFDNTYALRIGYDRDNFSFGAGFGYRRLKIDYAYKMLDYIEDSHRFSLSFLVGTPVSQQLRKKQLEEQRRGTMLLEDERRRQFSFYKRKADKFYEQFRLDSALTYYQRALAFDEKNEEIIGTIAAIESARRIQLERERELRQTEQELQRTIDNYYAQAQNFYAKKYYAAALDMLALIFDINPYHSAAKDLKVEIEDAISSEIALNLEIAAAAEKDGQYLAALEAYERVLDLDAQNVKAQNGKRRIVQRLDQTQQLNSAISLFKAGNYTQARQRFRAVLAIEPGQPVAVEYIRRIDQALAKPPTLEDIQKDKEIWQLYLDGLRYMRNKEYRKAIEAWEKVLQVYPNNSNTLNNIQQARLRLKSEETE
jgi:tetratricopeptide (TPR) repeat protein